MVGKLIHIASIHTIFLFKKAEASLEKQENEKVTFFGWQIFGPAPGNSGLKQELHTFPVNFGIYFPSQIH